MGLARENQVQEAQPLADVVASTCAVEPAGPQPRAKRARAGFTLIEVLVAMALLGFALLGLFSLHNMALRSSRLSARMSVCAMLARTQMEYLMGLPFPAGSGAIPTDLKDLALDPTSASAPYAYLPHPNGGVAPIAINTLGTTSSADGPLMFHRTWDVAYPFAPNLSVIQLTVRVSFNDGLSSGQTRGVTITSYRFQDLP